MPSLYESRREQMFPKLTAAQLARLESYGQRQRTREGDVLTEPGERYASIVAVLSGQVAIVRSGLRGETPIVRLERGDFSGEMSALRGSASFVRIRVQEAGEVIAITVENVRRLVQADAELSEIFMRAFILRRMGLMEQAQHGDVARWARVTPLQPSACTSSWTEMPFPISASTRKSIMMRERCSNSFTCVRVSCPSSCAATRCCGIPRTRTSPNASA